MERVREELSKWGGLAVTDLANIKSLDQMSYWLAANLPLSDKDKIELLEHNCSIQRVRSELKLMQKVSSSEFAPRCCPDIWYTYPLFGLTLRTATISCHNWSSHIWTGSYCFHNQYIFKLNLNELNISQWVLVIDIHACTMLHVICIYGSAWQNNL